MEYLIDITRYIFILLLLYFYLTVLEKIRLSRRASRCCEERTSSDGCVSRPPSITPGRDGSWRIARYVKSQLARYRWRICRISAVRNEEESVELSTQLRVRLRGPTLINVGRIRIIIRNNHKEEEREERYLSISSISPSISFERRELEF
jgi:hypothetical protein